MRGIAALSLLVPGAVAAAQVPTFSTSVETVRVDVLVTERNLPVQGLQPEDFEVLDNGVPQNVEWASSEPLPVNVVLALDVSGSVSGRQFEALREAGRAVVSALTPEDRTAVLTFSNVLTVGTGLTRDAQRVRAALEMVPAAGDTSLVDATYTGLVLAESEVGRGLVIVLSDGTDTASFLYPDAVLRTARRSEGVVYAVSLSNMERGFLMDLCAQTGGRALRVDSPEGIARTFLEILTEFRQRYLLSYTPQGVPREGWHELRVRVRRRRVQIEARPGYIVGS